MRASSSSEHDAVVARRASTAVEEISRKSDSPDTRAAIRRWAGEAATTRITGQDAIAVEPNQLAENAVVNRPQLAMAREGIPCMTRKKKAE